MEWMLDVDKQLDVQAHALWQRRCIYRVPAWIKDLNRKAYTPRVVSLGPFHHSDGALLPMEEHKQRAVRHLMRRAKQPPEAFVAAVDEVAEQLQSAYVDLGSSVRRSDDEGRALFVKMMIVDGCFLLEVMRAAGSDWRKTSDYAPNDPIFSHHGVLYMVPYIRRDMLMLENQLPLLVLHKLLAVENANKPPPNAAVINRMVQKFMSPASRPVMGDGLRLHPLDVHRQSMLYGSSGRSSRDAVPEGTDIIRPALELYEAGVRFKRSGSGSLRGIRFRNGVLIMPAVVVDASTEYILLNMMAFERLHVGAGNDVTAYAFFMDGILKSAKDVALLSKSGIIQNALGSDEAVAKLFNSISKDVVLEPDSALDAVHREVNAYCSKPWNVWRANVKHNYFRSPTSLFNFLAGVIALGMTIAQTAYTILSFYKQLSS